MRADLQKLNKTNSIFLQNRKWRTPIKQKLMELAHQKQSSDSIASLNIISGESVVKRALLLHC
jgi:hypothetical protein